MELAYSRITSGSEKLPNLESFVTSIDKKRKLSINGSAFVNNSYLPKVVVPNTRAEQFYIDRGAIIHEVYDRIEAHEAWGSISFSWESENTSHFNEYFSPNIIVVIGYSFPTFNREMDRKLLAEHLRTDSKIYVQCNYRSTEDKIINGNEEVRSKLKGMGIQDHQIELVETSDEFLIPFEFNQSLPEVDHIPLSPYMR